MSSLLMTSFKFLTKFATKKAMGLMLLSVMAFSAVVAIVGGMGKQQQQQNQVTVQNSPPDEDAFSKCDDTMSAKDCAEYISTHSAYDQDHVKISYPRKFNYYRIWIEVDENGFVINTPARG